MEYKKFMGSNPTELDKLTNWKGQEIVLYEGEDGDLSPVVCVSHKLELAANSDFFDTDDLTGGDDYEPCFVDGELKMKFEV